MLVGAVLDGPGPDYVSNTGIVWDPATGPGDALRQAAPGALRRVHPVPRPARRAGRAARPDPARLLRRRRPGVARRSGRPRVGDVICFEVAYDGLVRDVVDGGADVLVVQTNNATYNGTAQPAAAARDVAAAGRRARPRRCWSPSTSGHQRGRRPGRHVWSQTRTGAGGAHAGARGAAARRRGPSAARLGAWPEWLLAGLAVAAPCSRAGSRRPARARHGAAAVSAGGAAGAEVGQGVLVVIPTYNERAEHRAGSWRGCAPRCRAPTCWSSTTPAPTAPARSPTGSRPRTTHGARPAPARQAGSRRGLRGGLPLGPGAGLRRPGRDGRRRVAPARAAAAPARRPSTAPTWCWARAGCRAAGSSTGRAPAAALPRRQHVRPARARSAAARRHRRLPRLPARRRWRSSTSTGWRARATASRSTWPGARCAAGLRVVEVPITFVERETGAQQDEPGDRPRGAVAGDRLGRSAHRCGRTGRGSSREELVGVVRLLVVLFLVVPIVEIYVIVQVGEQIGALPDGRCCCRGEPARARGWSSARAGGPGRRCDGAVAHRPAAQRRARRRGAGAGRRHPAAHTGLRHRHRRVRSWSLPAHPAARPRRGRCGGSPPGGRGDHPRRPAAAGPRGAPVRARGARPTDRPAHRRPVVLGEVVRDEPGRSETGARDADEATGPRRRGVTTRRRPGPPPVEAVRHPDGS